MKTNDIKKGMRIKLRNGWEGTMQDNRKGNTRMVEVEGFVTEIGSVYSHDIIAVEIEDEICNYWEYKIEYTKSQKDLRKTVSAFGF